MRKWRTIEQDNPDIYLTEIDLGTPSFPVIVFRFENLITRDVSYLQRRED